MFALDTNLLVYAHRPEMPFHAQAIAMLRQLAAGSARWAVPWPCAHEFVAVITNPRIFKEPSSLREAFVALGAIGKCPNAAFLAEGDGYLEVFEAMALPAEARGGMVHDARVAAICKYHGVQELWTADRDFSRFPQLRVRNPLVAA